MNQFNINGVAATFGLYVAACEEAWHQVAFASFRAVVEATDNDADVAC